MSLQIQPEVSYAFGVAKTKSTVGKKTTDTALVIAMRALVKVLEGDGMPQLIAQTALTEIGDPTLLLGLADLLAPIPGRNDMAYFASILDERAETRRHYFPKTGPKT